MTQLLRYDQKVFGSTAPAGQIAKFGSLQAGAPVTYSGATVTPDTIQALSNYLTGWFGAVMANNSPTLEDYNAICYLFTYQVAYLCQKGIPEWCAATTYYIGSVVTNAAGDMYRSLTNTNLNNVVTNLTYWKPYNVNPAVHSLTVSNSPYTITTEDRNQVLLIDSSTGLFNVQLPNPATNSGVIFTIKDSGGMAFTNQITLLRYGSEKIEGIASNFICEANFGKWQICCDGTNFFFI